MFLADPLPKAGIAAVVLSLDLAAPVAAGPFEDGIAAYSRGDYPTAMELLRPLADQGNASAQSYLGFMYENGRGVPQDDAIAVSWYRKAADQGHAPALIALLLYATKDDEPGRRLPDGFRLAQFYDDANQVH